MMDMQPFDVCGELPGVASTVVDLTGDEPKILREGAVPAADVLSRLRPGASLINTARAEIVDYDALRAVAREKHLRVALDVFPSEPAASTGDFADPIVQDAGVYGTHHIGASTDQAQEAIAAETVRIVDIYLKTGKAPNAVN